MSNIRQAGGKIHFSQIMPEKSKIGDKTSSKEWRKIKEDAKQSAISICNRNSGIKTKVDEIAVRLQKRINRDNLTHDKMTEYSSELIKAGLNLSDTAELLKNILIMARHEGSGAEAPNTKINWFGSTNKTKAISDFLKGRGNDQNNKFQESSENELITPLVHSLVHTYVANAGHGLTLSENLEENNPNPNKKLNSLNETQINSQYEKAFEYISRLDDSLKSEYPNDQAHVLNSAYYSNATKSTLQNSIAKFLKTCPHNVQELCKDIKDVDLKQEIHTDEERNQKYLQIKQSQVEHNENNTRERNSLLQPGQPEQIDKKNQIKLLQRNYDGYTDISIDKSYAKDSAKLSGIEDDKLLTEHGEDISIHYLKSDSNYKLMRLEDGVYAVSKATNQKLKMWNKLTNANKNNNNQNIKIGNGLMGVVKSKGEKAIKTLRYGYGENDILKLKEINEGILDAKFKMFENSVEKHFSFGLWNIKNKSNFEFKMPKIEAGGKFDPEEEEKLIFAIYLFNKLGFVHDDLANSIHHQSPQNVLNKFSDGTLWIKN